MPVNTESLRQSARFASQASSTIERGLSNAQRKRASIPAQIGLAISLVKLGRQVLPVGLKLLRRHPVAGAVLLAGAVWGLYSYRGRRPNGGSQP